VLFRSHEKTFLREHGFPTADFALVRGEADLQSAANRITGPAILKVSRFGYDGKGQARVEGLGAVRAAWEGMKRESCVLEQRVPLDVELSVVLARGADGAMACWPAGENRHADGILDITVVPARVNAALTLEAEVMARRLAGKLDYVGVLAVEFFVSGGRLLVNEIAPRPHNSGHYTLDACVTDQFEQQVRALCGLPLGDTRLLSPVVMVNLLGDLWRDGHAPPWDSVLRHPNAKLHLYGKREARPGRKMGHYNVLAADVEMAHAEAIEIRQRLAAPKAARERLA
jgi:5-(carboxyamino)imidazole ribonucleotide synthase